MTACCVNQFQDYYIYIIYTPNLGLWITRFDREREQGRFRGSNEEARRRSKGVLREQEGSRESKGEQKASTREHGGALRRKKRAERAQQEKRYSGFSKSLIWLHPTPLQLLLLFDFILCQ